MIFLLLPEGRREETRSQGKGMKLTVATPLAIVVDADDVAYVRAEDETGAFGVLPGHADFLTALSVSAVVWRDGRGVEHYVAVRGGVLEVSNGRTVAIATPQALAGENLRDLQTEVLTDFRRALDEEKTARVDAEKLYLAAVRQICKFARTSER
jgi:F-type H+-transporting ATPase subunit epsilon